MKHRNLQTLRPRSNEFYQFTKGKLSEGCSQSMAYQVTASLFSTAERLYNSLNEATSERLSQFVEGVIEA